MVEIRYMSEKGDTPLRVTVQESKQIIKKEQAAGKLVVNLSENAVVTKATMGQIKEETKVGVYQPVAGG